VTWKDIIMLRIPFALPSKAMFQIPLGAAMLLGLVFSAPSMHAQTELPAADPNHTVLTVTSRLVVLDVVVTDPQGRLVPGLKKDDFVILQDGNPQRAHSFDSWNDRPPAVAAPAIDRFGHQDWGADTPLTIFVLDEMNTPFDEKSFAVENLRSYLRRQPPVLTSPSMLVTVNYTGLNTLSAYTRDRDALLHAIDRRPPALPAHSSGLELVSASFAMLRQIAVASEGLHTHKSVIWLGRGFPAIDPMDFDDASNVILKKAIEDTVNLLIAARVTLYQVDPITTDARTDTTDINVALAAGSGINSHMASTGTMDLLDQNFSINRFVIATGGQLYYGRNDLDNFIADSEHRTSEFYTLSYVPPSAVDEDVYHTISVQMKNPTLHAETRQGFYSSHGPPAEPSLRDLGFDMKLASTSAMTYSSVAASISGVAASRTPGKIAVNFSVEDSTLQWTPRQTGDESAKLTILLVSLDKDHNIQSSNASTLDIAVKEPSDVADGRLKTEKDIAVNAKTCSVRLIVRDSSGRIGTADISHQAISAVPTMKTSPRCDVK
jgi:VWFA-related protein